MRAPDFWWRREPGLLAHLLSPLAFVYGAIAARRMANATAFHASVPVICIGNPTVGGAGKTPTALYVASRLQAMGRRPVFLTRGYGGRITAPTLVDASHGPADCGDEPLLLARAAPTVIAADRAAGARLAAQHGDVIVMDDGFQNPSLNKDFSLLVIDGAAGVGNGHCVPAGPLRAPLDAQWPKADAVIVIGAGQAGQNAASSSSRPVFKAKLAADPVVAESLKGTRVLGFAGIGRPQKFFATLEVLGALLILRRPLPDHHAYTHAEIAALVEEAALNKSQPVTTEKDFVKIASVAPDLAERVAILPVTLALDDPQALDAVIAEALTAS